MGDWRNSIPQAPQTKSWRDSIPTVASPAPAKSEDTGVLSYLKNTLNKTAQNMNVENILHAVDEVGNSIHNGTFSLKDTINRLDPSTDAIYNDTAAKLSKGDYSGATANVLPLVAAVDGGAIREGITPSAQTMNRLSVNSKALGKATGNMAKTTAADLGAATVANAIPVVGHGLSMGLAAKALVKAVKNGSAAEVGTALKNLMTMAETPEEVAATVKAATDAKGANAPWRQFPDVHAEQAAPVEPITTEALPSGRTVGSIDRQTPMFNPEVKRISTQLNSEIRGANAAWRAIPDAPAAVPPAVQPVVPTKLPSGRVPGKISTEVSLPKTVTPTSSTNVVNGASAADSVSTLPKETTQALVDAHRNGDLAKLPAQAKAELTTAVKNGDSAKVNEIVEHSADVRKREAGKNKTDVIVDYVKAHNIDISQYTTAGDRQVLADKAYAHGLENGMDVPIKTGRYRGISDESWGHIQRKLNGE